jgi:hypothetical protein
MGKRRAVRCRLEKARSRAEEQGTGGQGAEAWAGQDDAQQVEGIGWRDSDLFRRLLEAARGAQQLNGFRECELFPGQPGHEAAATDLAARFHAPERDQQVAPGRRQALSRQQIPEHHAPAT